VPFNKTTIMTLVPRYVLINKLDTPVIIRQRMGDLESKTNKKYNFMKTKIDSQSNLHLNIGKRHG